MSDAAIRTELASLLHTTILNTPSQRIAGGCSNECYRYETGKGSIFVKVASTPSLSMFEGEIEGLNELRKTNAVRVPDVIASGTIENRALLVLEWIDLQAPAPTTDALLGEQLAQLHRTTKPLYGWKQNNFIGATPQTNLWSRDWFNFWRERRFEAQLDIAEQNCANAQFIERATLLNVLMDGFFTSYVPVASLLHGDLWSGNYAADAFGTPVLFDPAVYFGDRECDIAMTQLFSGFSNEFYSAYQSAWQLDDGWRARVELYNLYHVLNHFNLFGGEYLSRAEAMVGRLLAETGH